VYSSFIVHILEHLAHRSVDYDAALVKRQLIGLLLQRDPEYARPQLTYAIWAPFAKDRTVQTDRQDSKLKLDTRAMEWMVKGTLALGAVIAPLGLGWDFFVMGTGIKAFLVGAAGVLVLEAFLFLCLVLVALHVDFGETRLVRQRGVWPFKRTDVVSYASITRVLASDFEVTVDLDDGRCLRIAYLVTEVAEGSLPDVEVRAGENAVPMRLMRKIARFIELAIEEQRAAS